MTVFHLVYVLHDSLVWDYARCALIRKKE